MADNRLYGGDVINPTMLGGASVAPKQQSLSGYTGSGNTPFINNMKNLEYDPYHRLKVSFLDAMGKTIDKARENQKNQAYLNGMSSQFTGMAEDEMETNILTRSWSKAGYRDMEGRMGLINYKASILSDLTKGNLDDLTPAEFQKYLQKQREDLVPLINNSSTLVRDQLLEKAIEEDVGLIQKHSERYAEAIYQKELNTWQMDFNLQLMDLDASVGSPYYNTAVLNVGSTLGMLMQNDRIDTAGKTKMATDVIKNLAYAGHVEAAKALRDLPIVDAGDQALPLRAILSPDEDLKLQKAIEAGFTKNKDQMTIASAIEREQTLQYFKENPNELTPDVQNEAIANVVRGVTDGTVSKGEVVSFMRALGKIGEEGQDLTNILSMYMRGDDAGLATAGVSKSKAGQYFLESISKLPVTEQIQATQGIITAGQMHGYTLAGLIAEPTIKRFINGGALEPKDQEIMNFLIETYNTGRFQSNKAQTLSGLVSEMDRESQAFLRGAFDLYTKPVSNDPSEIAKSWANAMGEMRSRLVAAGEGVHDDIARLRRQSDSLIDEKITNSVSNTGWLGDFFTGMGNRGLFRNSKISEEFWNSKGMENVNQSQTALYSQFMRATADTLATSRSYLSPEQIYEMSMDIVGKEAFREENSTYKMTFVSDPQSPIIELMDGVKTSMDKPELLRGSIDYLVRSSMTEDTRLRSGQTSVSASYAGGSLSLRFFDNSTGNLVSTQNFSTQEVMQTANYMAYQMDTARDAKVSTIDIRPQGAGGPTLKINTAIDENMVGEVPWDGVDIIAARQALYSVYGAKWEYDKRDTTVGVGMTHDNPYYPDWIGPGDKLSDAEFDSLFIQSTSYAMAYANKGMGELSMNGNESAYKSLLTVLAMQDPIGVAEREGKVGELMDKIEAKDIDGAVQVLQSMPIYWSAAQRTEKAQEASISPMGVQDHAQNMLKLLQSIYN